MIETVIVCGGRDYLDRAHVFSVMNLIEPSTVIHGGASGADALASEWCGTVADVVEKKYSANWEAYGRKAGSIRNQLMLDDNTDVDLVIAFPGGAGTEDMIRRAAAGWILILRA